MKNPTSRLWNATIGLRFLTLSLVLPFIAAGAAETPVVAPAELHQRLVADSQARKQRVARVKNFFSSEAGRKGLLAGKMDAAKVLRGVALLSDEELARLAASADRAQADFAAGSLSNQELTYIVIALGTAVLILVILAA